jgi:hypothetical protein
MTGPPEGVHNCSVRNQSLNQLLFSCEPGDNGGLRQIFFLEVYHHQESSPASLSSASSALTNFIFTPDSQTSRIYANMSSVDVPDFLVQNLPSGTKFTFNVYAVNSKGRSPAVSYTTSTLSPPEKQTKTYGECGLFSFHSVRLRFRDKKEKIKHTSSRYPFLFQDRLFVQVEFPFILSIPLVVTVSSSLLVFLLYHQEVLVLNHFQVYHLYPYITVFVLSLCSFECMCICKPPVSVFHCLFLAVVSAVIPATSCFRDWSDHWSNVYIVRMANEREKEGTQVQLKRAKKEKSNEWNRV